jgi:hypothetical protein
MLLLVSFAASRARADDVFLATGPARSGTILQLTTNSILQKMSASILNRLGNGYSIGAGTNSPYIMISNADPQKQKTVEDVLRVVADLLGKTLFTNKPTAAFIVVIPNTMQDFTPKMGGKSTSAGFYNHATRTLTINLSTGTGTLVHEFTHALHFSDMEARGQMHPTWVREGLGSLYEESDPKEDRLDGLVNWRLPTHGDRSTSLWPASVPVGPSPG